MQDLILSPFVATSLFVLACFAGFQYRRVWVNEGPRWKLWVFGVLAGACLAIVAFIPVAANS